MESKPAKKYSFAEFELDCARKRLFKHGKPVALNYRTFELLAVLVERKGEILTKDELLETVWEGQFVEEGNLPVHISTLRKVFGEKKDDNHFIVTVPGRGYSFVADLKEETGGEIIVESHSLSHIVVEEEIRDVETGGIFDKNDDVQINLKDSPAISAAPRRNVSISLTFAGIIIIIVLSLVGYLLLRKSSAKNAGLPFQNTSIKRLTTKGSVSRAALSPDGKLFVYAIGENALESLWLGHVDGGEPIQIRPPASQVFLSMKFTPDGSSIYYAVSENYGDGTLYKIPVFGGASEKIYDNFRSLTFAPDSRQFAFLRYDEERGKLVIMTADAEGKNEREMAVLPSEIGSTWHSPAWSPDGLKIALTVSIKIDDTEIFIVNTADGSVKQLSSKPWRSFEGMSWLKDGSGLVGVGKAQETVLPQLWFVSFPEGEVHRLSNDLTDYGLVTSLSNENDLLTVQGVSQSNVWVAASENLKEAKQITFGSVGRKDGWDGLVWTQSGQIVYSAEANNGSAIFIMNADGSNSKQLIPNGGLNEYPSLTRDGRFVIFQSNRSGHYAVWRANFDGTNMVQLTGEQTAGQPFVSPDGKWIIYTLNIDTPGELWRMSLDGGEPFRMLDKPAGWAQISPDSKLVACETLIDDKIKLAVLSLESGELIKLFDTPRLANLRLGVHWTPDGKSVTYRDWANGIWRQNLDGGDPQRFDGLPQEKLFSYGWSPDGKFFAFTRGSTARDVVLISNNK